VQAWFARTTLQRAEVKTGMRKRTSEHEQAWSPPPGVFGAG
jgi:hypothetical protein